MDTRAHARAHMQITLNHKGAYMAAADDTGTVKVVEVWNRKPFKTLGEKSARDGGALCLVR